MSYKDTTLSQFFPAVRAKEQILEEIKGKEKLFGTYGSWAPDQQEDFLNICSGNKGIKLLYDSFFKEVLNPEYDSARLSSMLSALLQRKVTVKTVLPNDSTRLGDEMSLVITDIVVELEDKTLANIEVQKLGYLFTGERASCYSADLLLRQYKRLRDTEKTNFSYKDIAPVYTIVFLENSPSCFKKYKDNYIHRFSTISDTGLKLNMLQNFIFIPIDIFLEKLHNDGINNELEAWLTFLGCDEPEYIIQLIMKYPYFTELYQTLYDLCQNIERVMEMFSKELQILDRNTVKYMIDTLQEELNDTQAQLDAAKSIITDKDAVIADKDAAIAELQARLSAYESKDKH